MKYFYESYLSELKDLRHIEWFLNHIDEYNIVNDHAKALVNSLMYKIQKKNIFYSDIIREYNELISIFENNPYNYQFDVLKKVNIGMESNNALNYFIIVDDKKYNKSYYVPYNYLASNSAVFDMNENNVRFNNILKQHKADVEENFVALQSHYMNYLNSGISNAMERYKTINYGNIKEIVKQCVWFLAYNVFLLKVMHETQFINVILHFMDYFSDDPTKYYSAYYVFNGHTYLGILALIGVGYFIYRDLYYIYGIYYKVFIKFKYQNVYNYQNDIYNLYQSFYDDYNEFINEDIKGKLIQKKNHRNSIYIPLINKASRVYHFYGNRFIKEDKKFKIKEDAFIDVNVPFEEYYKKPMTTNLFKLILFTIYVETICNVLYVIF